MKFKDIEKVNSPIVYIVLSFILGSVIYGLYDKYLWLAVISASLFFVFTFFKSNMMFTIIVVAFFLLSLVDNVAYYKINFSNSFSGKVQIVEVKSYSKIATYKGKRFYLQGEGSKYKQGNNIYVEGELTKGIDKDKGILGSITVKKGRVLEKNLVSRLYDIREEIYEKLNNNLGRRKAALVSSLAFGFSDYLDEEDKEDMKNLGVIHAISVSGLHVALVFSFLRAFLGKGISLGITFIYVLFTGAPFSSLRALFMISLVSLAPSARKNYNPLSALALSAGGITLLSPYAPFQLGFQLSFLATLGMVLYSKKINNILYKLPTYIRKTVATSLSAQVFTMPIIMASFKECSFVFILGNLVLEPIFNILIILGNFLLLGLSINPIFDFISFVLLKVINILDFCTDYLYDLSSSAYIVNEGAVLIYCSMFISVYFYFKGIKKLKILPVAAAITAFIYVYSPIMRIDYLKEGGLLISYRGDRKIVSNIRNIDMGKLKKVTLAKEAFRETKNITTKNGLIIKAEGKNYLLKVGGKEYLLRMNNRQKINGTCDIINFVEKKSNGLFVIDDKILLY
ncbi:ComEC/Rec2 family competence protein [Clostridium cibarium]|uniref:ComEC/Rec2 family competence protein n=1 Tax=Clostridium cibarium TaxID=2762247 RepID=A0ABR8PNQ1_9CLOT|nr:ComEC/Rec2 family competence protein [Clostridium cibarium]MBD7909808.1 ComEC/Rec2 family competence protein [Clostridium cibarium]